MWTTLLFCGTAAMFASMAAGTLWHLRWARRLPVLAAFPAREGMAGRPRCSVIIAARDEEARIEGTIRHLLAQQGVEAEFIVVDDRSADGTGAILRRLTQEDSRVRVQRVDVLPEGWLGKCHACHVGASVATGEWILFTDADCWMKPDAIARALAVAERDGVDHVTLLPGTAAESLAVRGWHLLFLISTANWISGVNRNREKAYLGIGAFNLVRAAAYRECGGYEALRLTVLDDVKLGQLLRRAGKRTRAFLAADDVECHWGGTIGNMVTIMEKNYFAVTDYRIGVVLAGSLVVILVCGIIAAGLLSGTLAGLAAALAPFVLVLPAVILARRLGWSWPCALYVPFMFPVFYYAVLNSTIVTLRQGGIRWRETFYPLEALRAGTVR